MRIWKSPDEYWSVQWGGQLGKGHCRKELEICQTPVCQIIVGKQPDLTRHEETYPFIVKVSVCSPKCLRDERNDLVNRLAHNGRDTFRLVEHFKKCRQDVALNSGAWISLESAALDAYRVQMCGTELRWKLWV